MNIFSNLKSLAAIVITALIILSACTTFAKNPVKNDRKQADMTNITNVDVYGEYKSDIYLIHNFQRINLNRDLARFNTGDDVSKYALDDSFK